MHWVLDHILKRKREPAESQCSHSIHRDGVQTTPILQPCHPCHDGLGSEPMSQDNRLPNSVCQVFGPATQGTVTIHGPAKVQTFSPSVGHQPCSALWHLTLQTNPLDSTGPCRSMLVLTACSHWASRALVASSRMRTRGFRTRARAMARRCFCPTANWPPFSPISEEIREKSPRETHVISKHPSLQERIMCSPICFCQPIRR